MEACIAYRDAPQGLQGKDYFLDIIGIHAYEAWRSIDALAEQIENN